MSKAYFEKLEAFIPTYRAWHIIQQEMSYLSIDRGGEFYFHSLATAYHLGGALAGMYEDLIVMPYIGIKDNNGKPIYEHDYTIGRCAKTKNAYLRKVQKSRSVSTSMYVLLPNRSVMKDHIIVGRVCGNAFETPRFEELTSDALLALNQTLGGI